MPVTLNIIESTTELGVEVVEVVLESASAPGPAGPGVPVGGTDGQVLTKTSATDYATAWEDVAAAIDAAPTDATYLVTAAHADLDAEVVVGATPGGELGGTWASPTVDATHSGSSHADVQAAAEATAAAALSAHLTDTSDAHDASAISIADAGNDFTATDVEGALAELQSDHEADSTALSDHIADATAAHAATAIAFTPDGSIAATTVQAAIVEVRDEAGGGGAPTDVDYLVGTASGGLSAEIVVGTSPGGELGGTWASPTVDASHSGSTHAAVQAAAEATAAAALSAHLTDTSDAHDASAISADSTTLVGTGTDVQAVLEELDNGIADHIADATAAHAGTAISVDSTNLSGTGTTVQASLEELDNLLDDHSARHEDGGADEISLAGLSGTPAALQTHLDDASDAHDASAISVLDTNGDYTATDVEGVLAEIAPQLGGGGSAELDYVQFTSDVTISSTTEASADTIVTANAVVFDGSTTVHIEFFTQMLRTAAGADNQIVIVDIFEDGTAIGRVAQTRAGTVGAAESVGATAHGVLRRTPTAASHTYSARGWVTAAGNAVVQAGAGGATASVPGFIRIVEV